MFNFFNKSLNLIAPVSGKTIDLSSVPDPVFAQKMVGDGIAIDTTGSTIVAPADGVISLIMDTKHAFGMTLDNGVEILVHVGLDTVTLKGEGFEQLINQGTKVTAGTPILKIDRDLIQSKGISLITPVLITNVDVVKKIEGLPNLDVTEGKDTIINYKL
ncbi:PTS sugar transporter subunit IIA [Clostridium chauvoei]|uniref:PTS glucose transporter subunit IIA n=2 Tax=Clostridium chauvoei TaxID=46867 RepID=A0ABD4RKB9_9CLOT|nr:PTS glucose transporter subunit IIA [Clostridium chauvoei]ATD53783.1 PTS glucose transporter subunit IIA [Clostridium chauvoei]ATD58409.1 PTS glucose transporter subunit IIA [Clostridium chauvoei]MBX7281737.1 PTS glucose transporter subunit IIA [Clostridium chauvoei]MBX7284290.1 PTS glucose transporter subunit IIA [Clostridium chauvoei]MBX7286785.1 PTS glucose transporter subunit IIA [Clostridium chauvoei]